MTRCCRDYVNLKSSAYNQTGESNIEQHSLHRLMCMHTRRVLLAKSVVDSRNPRYTQTMQRRSRPSSCKLRFSDKFPSDETIDKLAYDTEHHPSQIIRVQCRSKSFSKERSCSRDRVSNDANCPCLRPSTAKEHTAIVKSSLKNEKKSENFLNCRSLQNTKGTNYEQQQNSNSKYRISSCHSARSSCREWNKSGRVVTSLGNESERSCPTSGLLVARTSRQSCVEISSSIQQDDESFRKLVEREEEEARYGKFVYDITQEIVQNGLYTDRELKEVFEKHLHKNSGRLSKRRMLYEIYQLKISLSMLDDSEEEDEMEDDLIYAERFSNLRVPKPPTPPKILNENKIIEKLELLKQLQENCENGSPISSPSGRKSVQLVDANPELVITERDVLSTLAENHVEPDQIQRIYRNLYQKSKGASLNESLHPESDIEYLNRPKQVDRCSSAISLNTTYTGGRPLGILRKETTDFTNKSSSPELSRHRLSYLMNKQNEALEKCAKWKTCNCDCKTQLNRDQKEPEKEKTQSLIKVPSSREKPVKKDAPMKRVKVIKQASAEKKGEKLKAQRTDKKMTRKEVKSSSETSEPSSEVREIVTVVEEKHDPVSEMKTNIEVQAKSLQSDDNDEIEEDIESVIDELPERTPRKSPKDVEKSDNEEKESSSVPEKLEKEEEEVDEDISIASDESIKYSDFSDLYSKPSSTSNLKV